MSQEMLSLKLLVGSKCGLLPGWREHIYVAGSVKVWNSFASSVPFHKIPCNVE